MTDTPFHSQASNFFDCLKTGVDNRTGQFTLALVLPLPPANHLCGPALSLNLAFNTLGSMSDRGYGQGWNLGLSELYLDQETTRLTLTSGEQFAIDMDTSSFAIDQPLRFLDQKLETLQLLQQADGSLKVEKKNGESEILRQQQSSPRFLVEEMRSAEGRRLFLDWQPFGDNDCMLQQIRDEQRTILLLEKNDDAVHLTLNPGTAQSATLRLLMSNDRLTQIQLPDIAPSFEIEYDTLELDRKARLLLPAKLRSPLGSTDIVHWATGKEGHHLPPGSPFPYLPRVASWTHSAGAPHNELNRSYTWVGDSNFLGFGSDQAFVWDIGRDNLYQTSHDYQYQVIETMTDALGETLGTTSRTWNRFHLLTEERSQRGQCEVLTLMTYGIDPALEWPQQSVSCQLPHQVTTCYRDHSRENAIRSEIITYRYDAFGNIVEVHYPNGVQEYSEYYPAQGSEGCPADPLGLVRHLKCRTVVPAPGKGEAPTLGYRYTYQTLPSLLESAPAHLVIASEECFAVQDDRVLQRTEHSYVSEPGALYARERQSVTYLGGKTTTTRYDYQLTKDELIIKTTVIGFENDDENSASQTSAQSLLTGQTTWERDRNATINRYQYDVIGRIVRTTNAVDTPFQTIRTARYHLHDGVVGHASMSTLHSSVMIEQTDVHGCRQRQWLDGDGRVVMMEKEDLDHAPGTFREVSRQEYDALGRLVSQTQQDWLGENATQPLVLTSTTVYDDWGQPALSTSPEGIEHHHQNDPVTLRSEHWQSAGQWVGRKLAIRHDSSGNPIEQQHLTPDGKRVRTLTQVRDGLGRTIEERIETDDVPAIITRMRYDDHGRVCEHVLADGTVLSWTYAAHSNGPHVETMMVTPQTEQVPGLPLRVGHQTFDGLGRQLSVEVGGRTTRHHYRPGQMPPVATTLADGNRVAFRYEPSLGNALIVSRVAGQPRERLTYHERHYQPTQAEGELGHQQWRFTPSGKPQHDIWTVDGQTHETHWQYSLNGLLLGFTDAAGIQHQRMHDAFGRLASIKADRTRTSFTYDALSRPATLTTEDLVGDRVMNVQLDYDSLGRESRRTFSVTEGEQRQTFYQTLVYSPLDQLLTRTWQEDGRKTEEHFAYDLRGRLVHYRADGEMAPQDPFGNVIVEQRFRFNAVDGLQEVHSTFADGTDDTALFRFAETDPTQVVSITHTHPSWPAKIDLSYDACGRLVHDSLGRRMTWNSQDRLTSVRYQQSTCHYRYNPSGQLCDRVLDGTLIRSFYSGAQLTHQLHQGEQVEMMSDGATLFALNKVAEGVQQSILLGCDGQGSVRLQAGAELHSRRYSVHGADSDPAAARNTAFGYCGEQHEPLTGWIIPDAYRPYDPVLMCFLSPDNESPFGRGGINPYTYCGGDPVNRVDPDGHSWVSWVAAAAGVAISLAVTVSSMGSAVPAIAAMFTKGIISFNGILAVATATLNSISLGTGVAALALETSGKDEQAASVLGWISLGTGLASSVTSMMTKPTQPMALTRKMAHRARTSPVTKPVRKWYASEVLFEKNYLDHDVSWHSNFLGKGYQAFETHGSPFGHLMNSKGKMVDPLEVTLKEIAPRLGDVDANVPLFLLACEGGKSGAAQRVADVLRRPVYGYDKVITLYDITTVQRFTRQGFAPTVPMQKISRWRRFLGETGPFKHHPSYEDATGKIYHPR